MNALASMPERYHAFLGRKKPVPQGHGLEVDLAAINPDLKPHVRIGVQWALRGGRRAIFWRFGMQKTTAHLEIMRLLGQVLARMHAEEGAPQLRLIALPLGVRREFFLEAEKWFKGDYAVKLKFIRTTAEIEGPEYIYLTNYESLREGLIDLSLFGAISLDEAAVLRSFGSKTFGEFLFGDAMGVHFRFVATATPDPNEYLELIAYAHFLGVMDMGEAKTRFFKRDSEKADNLKLHPHKEEEFWLWVSTWSMFLQRPSDLGPEFSDEGYDLPPLDVHWHELPTDHQDAGEEKGGQKRLIKQAAVGVSEAAREKRDSLPARIAKLLDVRAWDHRAHRIIWHDLEAERAALERQGVVTVYGTQDLEKREALVASFADGHVAELGAKPVMLGAGGNLQRHCAWAVFLGIGHKFNDFIQAVHRLRRYGQLAPRVRLDLIYTEAERPVRENLEAKWKRHDRQAARMAAIIRKYGLAHGAVEKALERSMGVPRRIWEGRGCTLVNNDSVLEVAALPDNSAGMVLTSVPFSTQYEYSPCYNDFGHTDDEAHFFEQMDFITPELVRVLKPGRVMAVHCKNRVVPGAINGIRFQTISRFVDRLAEHYERHGLWFMGEKIISTDVIKENDQTYRLGYGNLCKDSTRLGCGLPEYLLIFRKTPTNRDEGWADERVLKDRAKFSLGRWQYDAHAFQRSSGDRLLMGQDLLSLKQHQVWRLFKRYSLGNVYDFERDVNLAERLDAAGKLPHDRALVLPHSWHPDIWTDVTRIQTLNNDQSKRGREKHLCPLQLDVVDRAIALYTNPGDLVIDPFSGIGTVPVRAVRAGRIGWGCELKPEYHDDAVWYAKREEAGLEQPTLFGIEETLASEEEAHG